MSEHVSLQRRLGLGLTLAVTLLWLATTLVTAVIARHSIDRTLDSALEETAQRILSLAVVEIINRESADLSQQVVSLYPHDEYITYLVRRPDGTVLLASHDVDLSAFPVTPRKGLRSTATHRLYGASAVSDTFFIEAAEPLTYRREASREMLAMLLLPLLVLMPASLLGIWWFTRHSLGGLLAYREALEARDAGDLSPVDARDLPAELVPVAEAVDHLLARLRRALEAERSFTANTAHELRTPLAATLAQVQRLRRTAPEGPLRDRATRIEGSLRELSRLAEKLMQLARAEGAGLLAEAPQDVLPVIAHVVDDVRRLSGSDLTLSLPAAGAVVSSMDPDALAILLRNLLENAIKHGASDQAVEVELTHDGILRVRNAGPIVAAEQLARLRERFVRAPTRASGAGLGLAIASAIAAGTGATLELASPATGREDGFEAGLRLPA